MFVVRLSVAGKNTGQGSFSYELRMIAGPDFGISF